MVNQNEALRRLILWETPCFAIPMRTNESKQLQVKFIKEISEEGNTTMSNGFYVAPKALLIPDYLHGAFPLLEHYVLPILHHVVFCPEYRTKTKLTYHE